MQEGVASTVIYSCLNGYKGKEPFFHNNKRVASWYNPEMEVQVNVAQGDGELVHGKTGVYFNDDIAYKWYNFRIPKNAKTDPIDNDHVLQYPLECHIEAIGMTGWNWKKKKSVRIGFDFDSITGHAEGVGISDAELEEIRSKLMHVPEALVLKSSGGLGLHLYFEFDPENLPDTQNHTEHAALALACLRYLSQQVGFDFQTGLDVGGVNMWIWHKKMTLENKGFTLIKDNVHSDGSRACLTVPDNWELYIDVASRKRQKVRIEGVTESDETEVAQKASAQKNIQLDDKHKRIISDLQKYYPNYTTCWLSDHHLLQTHTHALSMYFKDRQKANDPLEGVFETLSEGREPSKPNCFCFPLADGGFRVCRFGKGTHEHDSWETDKGAWTYTYYNKKLNFFQAANTFLGVEDEQAGFTFPDAQTAISAVQSMGHKIEVPEELSDRTVRLKPHKGGRLCVEIESIKDEDQGRTIVGWVKKPRGGWVKIFNIPTRNDFDLDANLDEVDDNVRAVITVNNTLAGWFIKHEQGMWMQLAKDDARSKLKAMGQETPEPLLGHILTKAWIQVSIPFREEFPGNRQWNMNAAQLRFNPATDIESSDGESLHPHWDKILTHIGMELDDFLPYQQWATRNNIKTGYDYLLAWVACMIREPFEPLPYLFLYGLQNSGKSIFYEALSLLLTHGVVNANTALTSQGDYNGELAGAILCYIEEKNIAKESQTAYSRIKDWVTSKFLSIHAKYKQVYQQRNSTHWVQCANDKEHCPVFPGDTRITAINVADLITGTSIPKPLLLAKLEEEAPAFLATVLSIPLPEHEDRLRLPIVATGNKEQMERSNMTSLETFIDEHSYHVLGACVPFNDFFTRFYTSLAEDEKSQWTKVKVINALPTKFPYGSYDNIKCIGNISFEQAKSNGFTYITRDHQLVKRTKTNG